MILPPQIRLAYCGSSPFTENVRQETTIGSFSRRATPQAMSVPIAVWPNMATRGGCFSNTAVATRRKASGLNSARAASPTQNTESAAPSVSASFGQPSPISNAESFVFSPSARRRPAASMVYVISVSSPRRISTTTQTCPVIVQSPV